MNCLLYNKFNKKFVLRKKRKIVFDIKAYLTIKTKKTCCFAKREKRCIPRYFNLARINLYQPPDQVNDNFQLYILKQFKHSII